MKDILLRVAGMIAHAKMHPAPFPAEDKSDFISAIEAGTIKIEDSQVSFAAQQLLVKWTARYCAQEVSAAWQDIDKATQELRTAESLRVRLKLSRSFSGVLINTLENDYGCKVLARLADIARGVKGQNANSPALNALYFIFCDALPQLKYEAKDLANQLSPVLEATESYNPSGLLHQAIEQLAAVSENQALAMIEAFLEEPARRSVELAANALKALWDFNPAVAHKRAIELSESNLTDCQQVGVVALSWFRYDPTKHVQELESTAIRLEELARHQDDGLLPAISQAYGTLIGSIDEPDILERVKSGFLELASNKAPRVQWVVANILFRSTGDLESTDWFWDALDCMAGVPAAQTDILNRLDWTTYKKTESDPERVMEYLKSVVMSRPYGMEGAQARLHEIYEHTVAALIDKQQTSVEAAITRWFTSRESRLILAAADLVSRLVSESRRDSDRVIQLDKSELGNLTDEDVQQVVCAIIGFVQDYGAMASLLISVLSRGDLSSSVLILIDSGLAEVALYNKPLSVGEYLRDVVAKTDTSANVRQLIEQVLARTDQYFVPLENRPDVKELMPPDIRAERFRSAEESQRYRVYQKIMFDESGFMGMIPTVPVKYGRSTIPSGFGSVESSQPMMSVRTDVELPRGEIIDPVGQMINRARWCQMAISGLKDGSLDSSNSEISQPADNKSE